MYGILDGNHRPSARSSLYLIKNIIKNCFPDFIFSKVPMDGFPFEINFCVIVNSVVNQAQPCEREKNELYESLCNILSCLQRFYELFYILNSGNLKMCCNKSMARVGTKSIHYFEL